MLNNIFIKVHNHKEQNQLKSNFYPLSVLWKPLKSRHHTIPGIQPLFPAWQSVLHTPIIPRKETFSLHRHIITSQWPARWTFPAGNSVAHQSLSLSFCLMIRPLSCSVDIQEQMQFYCLLVQPGHAPINDVTTGVFPFDGWWKTPMVTALSWKWPESHSTVSSAAGISCSVQVVNLSLNSSADEVCLH